MTLKLRPPSKRRASALGSVLGTLGTAVGTVVGALPLAPARRKSDRTGSILKIALPVTASVAILAVVARRRRGGDAESRSAPMTSSADTEFAAAPTPAAPPTTPPVTQTARENAEATGDDGATATETARAAASETPAAGEAGER